MRNYSGEGPFTVVVNCYGGNVLELLSRTEITGCKIEVFDSWEEARLGRREGCKMTLETVMDKTEISSAFAGGPPRH